VNGCYVPDEPVSRKWTVRRNTEAVSTLPEVSALRCYFVLRPFGRGLRRAPHFFLHILFSLLIDEN
jgi:hypothetical protein